MAFEIHNIRLDFIHSFILHYFTFGIFKLSFVFNDSVDICLKKKSTQIIR